MTALSEGRSRRAKAVRRLSLMSGWAQRHEYIAATAFLLVLLCLYFWPLALGNQLGQNHVLYGGAPWRAERPAHLSVAPRASEGDVAYEYQPLLEVARTELRHGNIPVWNPYSSGGMPLLGDMQEALYYPLTWIALVLPVGWAWGLIAVLKLLTAGVGAYAFSRGLRVRPTGSLAAAVAYMLQRR